MGILFYLFIYRLEQKGFSAKYVKKKLNVVVIKHRKIFKENI